MKRITKCENNETKVITFFQKRKKILNFIKMKKINKIYMGIFLSSRFDYVSSYPACPLPKKQKRGSEREIILMGQRRNNYYFPNVFIPICNTEECSLDNRTNHPHSQPCLHFAWNYLCQMVIFLTFIMLTG